MGMQSKAGSFSLNTSTGNQAITGVGFTPKAVIFSWTALTAAGSAADAGMGRGVATSSTSRFAHWVQTLDANGSSDSDRRHTASACITRTNSSNTLVEEADFVSMDADGFTINVGTASTALLVRYIALGGDSITNATTLAFNSATAIGNQAITGVGFAPDFVMIQGNISSNVSPASEATGFFGTGYATSTAQTAIWHSQQNNNSDQAYHVQDSSAIWIATSTGSVFQQASRVSFDADGMTINWSVANGTARKMYGLFLKGGNYKIGNFSQKTSTGTSSVTGVGFRPAAIMLHSANQTVVSGVQNDWDHSMGWGTASSAESSTYTGSTKKVAPSSASTNISTSKVLRMMTESGSTPTTQAEADISTLDSDGFTLDWTTADATARDIFYAAFGPSGDSTPPTFTATWPKAESATTVGFTVKAKTNETGNCYYVVVADAASAPTSTQVKNGQDSTGSSALKSGTISLTADTEGTAVVTGLSSNTAYDVYFAAEDSTPNLQSSPTKVDVSTNAMLVQTATQALATASSVAVTLSPTTLNNLVVVHIKVGTNTETCTSVTDNVGNTYVVVGPAEQSTVLRGYQAYGIQTIAGATTITCNFSGGAFGKRVGADEYTMTTTMTNATVYNSFAVGNGNSAAAATATLTPTGTGKLIVASIPTDFSTTWTAGTGYTLSSGSGSIALRGQYKPSSSATETAPATLGGSGNWCEIAVAYNLTGAAIPGASGPDAEYNYLAYQNGTWRGTLNEQRVMFYNANSGNRSGGVVWSELAFLQSKTGSTSLSREELWRKYLTGLGIPYSSSLGDMMRAFWAQTSR